MNFNYKNTKLVNSKRKMLTSLFKEISIFLFEQIHPYWFKSKNLNQ